MDISYRPLKAKDAGLLDFSIKDTGIGIPDEKKENIFKAFYQGDPSITRKYGGTGLGLVISDMLLKKMESSLKFESTYKKGSRFYFSIRAKAVTAPFNGEKVSEFIDRRSELAGLNDIRILIADDNPINVLLTKRLLKALIPGAETAEACDGIQAVQKYNSFKPNLIFMDLEMPEMDGYSATQQIMEMERGLKEKTPIIALTAFASSDEEERCLKSGMSKFLSKPIDNEKLEQILYEFLIDKEDSGLIK